MTTTLVSPYLGSQYHSEKEAAVSYFQNNSITSRSITLDKYIQLLLEAPWTMNHGILFKEEAKKPEESIPDCETIRHYLHSLESFPSFRALLIKGSYKEKKEIAAQFKSYWLVIGILEKNRVSYIGIPLSLRKSLLATAKIHLVHIVDCTSKMNTLTGRLQITSKSSPNNHSLTDIPAFVEAAYFYADNQHFPSECDPTAPPPYEEASILQKICSSLLTSPQQPNPLKNHSLDLKIDENGGENPFISRELPPLTPQKLKLFSGQTANIQKILVSALKLSSPLPSLTVKRIRVIVASTGQMMQKALKVSLASTNEGKIGFLYWTPEKEPELSDDTNSITLPLPFQNRLFSSLSTRLRILSWKTPPHPSLLSSVMKTLGLKKEETDHTLCLLEFKFLPFSNQENYSSQQCLEFMEEELSNST